MMMTIMIISIDNDNNNYDINHNNNPLASLAETITTVLNYIIDHNEFPSVWAGGLRSAMFKSGKCNVATNISGVTILPIMEKCLKQLSIDDWHL